MQGILELIEQARPEDREEYECLTGKPFEALGPTLLEYIEEKPYHAHVEAVRDPSGALVAVGGLDSLGVCWFVTTGRVGSHKRDFCEIIKHRRDVVHQCYRVPCTNLVLMDNALHVRFLKYLGAEFINPVTINGREFRQFVIQPRSDNV
ncbi:internal virion protein [Ralstonia phage RSB2]|uniref:Putative internal virion protein A n=1 Tax=Ralstonia phage RSB2 TaxID=913183 RepID=E5RV22_9CAUD|nr:internal virion protein [Ralstonia phage RSB2]BAJ51830.1 putative internal virion protein A [Ralstonia phage RSB2]